ncbi:hypothetical protein QJQ45_018912 [Haematococcus lacustris]|nr:hypothetical protein QJQ45_018912 [Haematococcus lacustris]
MAERRAAEAEAKAQADAAEAEAQAQADAGAYEAQLHQLQPELQQREQQATDTQRLQHLQQQLQDLQQDELQRKEQQVAEQQQQLQQQQADMQQREQQVAQQQQQHIANADAQDLAGVLDARALDVRVDLDSATVQSWFVCPCKVGAKPRLACLQRQCAACKDRKKQLWHQYLAKHQRATFRAHCAAVRNTPGLVVVSCDWSEKLTIHQDIACQGAYWKQRTMSVFVACAQYQDMAGNYREESVFVSADRCDQSAEASTTALVQVIECLLQGKRHPDGIQGEASNTDGVSEGRDDGEGWVGKMDMRQLCLWSDGCASQFKGAKAINLH